ncbi:hypothetical protein BH10PLA2_BH10PLA2_08790 [soil metagenome]
MSTARSPSQRVPPVVAVRALAGVEGPVANLPSFAPGEWEAFRRDDAEMAKVIVFILSLFFGLGVLIYLTVLLVCIYAD